MPPDRLSCPDGACPSTLVVDWATALAQEVAALGRTGSDPGHEPDALRTASALCLSGGGVRSAAFCLGVIQGLARRGLLSGFDYLSTVSGGGYAGGWLLRRLSIERSIEEVCAELKAPGGEALRPLRGAMRFLGGRPGSSSRAFAVELVLWVRNTAVNWIVFAPVFLAAGGLAILLMALASLPAGRGLAVPWSFASVGAAFLCLAVGASVCLIPSARPPVAGGLRKATWRVVVPSLIWCSCATIAFIQFGHAPPRDRPVPPPVARAAGSVLAGFDLRLRRIACPPELRRFEVRGRGPDLEVVEHPAVATAGAHRCRPSPSPPVAWLAGPAWLWWLPAIGAAASLVGYVGGGWVRSRGCQPAQPQAPTGAGRDPGPFSDFVRFALSTLAAALLVRIGEALGQLHTARCILLLGPLWLVGCDLARTATYTLLQSAHTLGDLRREWVATVNANKLRFGLPLAFVLFAGVILPDVIRNDLSEVARRITLAVGLASGPLAILGGRSPLALAAPMLAQGSGKPGRAALSTGLGALALLFCAVLIALSGAADSRLLEWWGLRRPAPVAGGAAVLLAIVLTAAAFASRININRYSMHAIYRIRLIRGFLGSARPQGPACPGAYDDPAAPRRPDPVTDLDPRDNIRVSSLAETHRRAKCLFPVVNVTLNCAADIDPARAERRAVPFTITPLRSGAADLDSGRGAYGTTAAWASGERDLGNIDSGEGITLGSAMAISGAAISPSMGYHSSAAVSFLMTLFNVRLGAWLPNPARGPCRSRLGRPGPRCAYQPLFAELFGRSSAASPTLCLTDGGHFDNLGVYEMVRRRVGRILIVDAGEDPENLYADLGRVARLVLVDFGVVLSFDPSIAKTTPDGPPGAFGTVAYPATKEGGRAWTGEVLYLKPFVPTDVPVAIRAYADASTKFPHLSTSDQFFTEDDFESYRHLGEELCLRLFPAEPDPPPKRRDAIERGFQGARRALECRAASGPAPVPAPPAQGQTGLLRSWMKCATSRPRRA